MSEEVKESSRKNKVGAIIDSITNVAVTAVISLAVVFAYDKYVKEDSSKMYIVDYVEIINLKKMELLEAFKSGDSEKASNASKELETIIRKSAEIVGKVSAEHNKPVVNKQMLVTFDGAVDITPMVKNELIKSGLINKNAVNQSKQ